MASNNLICCLENLTKEQYSGNYRSKLPMLNASRDTLNPVLNAETLKNRLWVIEHYRTLHGIEHAYWPHYLMREMQDPTSGSISSTMASRASLFTNLSEKYKTTDT
jgi:hypothetical protein